MLRTRTLSILAVFLALALAACGTDLANEPQNDLATQACVDGWPVTWQQENRSADTLTAQKMLRYHGSRIAADGRFGPATEEAVKAFQRSKGLTADGKIGPQTWSKLVVVLERGSKGTKAELVMHLQAGLGGLAVDGNYGPATEQKVREFQQSRGLQVDGKVGPQTWRALLGACGGSAGGGNNGAYSLPIPKGTLPRSEYDDPHHDYPAIDLPTWTGTPAYAITSGTVSYVSGGCGYGILVSTSNGSSYKYCHLNSRSVGSGARVSAGQLIGYTGNTGNSRGPHLHLEVRAGGVLRCPQRLLLALYDGAAVPSPSSLPTSGCTY